MGASATKVVYINLIIHNCKLMGTAYFSPHNDQRSLSHEKPTKPFQGDFVIFQPAL